METTINFTEQANLERCIAIILSEPGHPTTEECLQDEAVLYRRWMELVTWADGQDEVWHKAAAIVRRRMLESVAAARVAYRKAA